MAVKRRFRVLRVVGIVLGLLVVAVVALGYSVFGGQAPIVAGARVGSSIEVVKDGIVDTSIVDVGDGHVALVDCGNDAAAHALRAALAQRQLGPDAVTAVFLTHGHGDHTAGCVAFPHAAVYALSDDVALAEGRDVGHSPLSRVIRPHPNGLHVTRALHDGETVAVGTARVQVYAVPGHTAGSAAYLVDGALFIGDSAALASDHTLRGAPWLFSDSTAQNHASLRALGARLAREHATVTALVPGHTAVATGMDIPAALQAL